MSGWIRVDRAIFSHPVFSDDLERLAWIWMIGAAAWRPHTVRYKNRMVEIDRGQFLTTERDLANRFGWSRKRARCFLEKLKKGTMIGATKGPGGTLVTVCNYKKYQDSENVEGPDKARAGAQGGPTEGPTDRTNKQLNNRITYSDRFQNFWKRYPHPANRGGKPKAAASFEKLTESEQLAAIASCKPFSRHCADTAWYTPPMAQTFLNQARWENWNAEKTPPQEFSSEDWEKRLAFWTHNAQWGENWGPAPNQPDCLCPQSILKRFSKAAA